jgi:dienelactone hydrolase
MFPAPLYQAGLKKAAPETRIPVERIQAPLLVTGGGKDGLWPAAEMAEEVAKYRRSCPYGKADEVLIYPNAGHGIEIPYGSVIDDGPFINGGDPAANAQARADAWPKIVAFLKKHLGLAHTP